MMRMVVVDEEGDVAVCCFCCFLSLFIYLLTEFDMLDHFSSISVSCQVVM